MESVWTEGTKNRKWEPLPGDMEAPDCFSPRRHFTGRAAKELAVHGAYTVKGLSP